MFASESILSTEYYQNLVAEQLSNQDKGKWIPRGEREGDDWNVIQFSTAPLATVLKKGPRGLNPPCICSAKCKHVSFFDALRDDIPLSDFCPDRNTFLVHRLPCWLTGLKNKREFHELPSVYHVFNVFSRGTYWWRALNGQSADNKPFQISREARIILYSSTGQPLGNLLFMETKQLLSLKCDESALKRLRNWFITLDGLLISILLASQGHPELCSWVFFDKVMQTYLKTACTDLYKQNDQVTYYSALKDSRNLMKDKILKERTFLPRRKDGKVFSGNFWYFDKIIDCLQLDVEILTPRQLKSISYLTQTRACGLPPKPIEVRAYKKFEATTGKVPEQLSTLQKFDLSRAVDSVCLDIKSQGNFEGLLNSACSHSKISLSNSASFFCTREAGGKTESARILLNEIPVDCPFFDLETGKVLYTFSKEDTRLTPGEKLFHFSILRALESLACVDNEKPHIGDVRVSTVQEPGKARIITISTLEHSVILHPMAHFLSVLLSTFPSSRTGLVASNHMWDAYKRIGRENIPFDGIYSGSKPSSIKIGSEDWESATDNMNPYPVVIIFDGLRENLGVPKFYTKLCSTLLTMPRRVYKKDILVSRKFSEPAHVKFNGIFQGDPCCKQVLHLSHLLSRKIARDHLRRIGLNSITPPFVYDLVGNRFGSIPNTMILRKRLSDSDYRENLKQIFKREELVGRDRRGRVDMNMLLSLIRNPSDDPQKG